jgi:uncharacterized RDD family membrane protein YckC
VKARAYDARERYLARRDRGAKIEIVTPEGVPLPWVIAGGGDRAMAFLADGFLVFLTLLVTTLLVSWADGFGNGWLAVPYVIFTFVLVNFYWAFFEIRSRGQTPGKRWVKIRVIDRHGGELTAGAVLTRNLMRHLELFVPLAILAAPESLWPGQPQWARGISLVWVVLVLTFPLWNRQRMRIGDVVAGTLVVVSPKAVLADDVGARQAATYPFTREQLGFYGIYELQVLEALLRDFDEGKRDVQALEVVAGKIVKKIGYPTKEPRALQFLRDFYAAQRAWLEQKMLFGKRREDKFSG